VKINLGSSTLILTPEGAAFFPGTATLVLSDVHLGKAATFRSSGIPIPEGDDQYDLARIRHLVTDWEAKRLVIAGDLFHARSGASDMLIQSMSDWLKLLEVPVTLVLGNHDLPLRRRCAMLPMELCESTEIEGVEVIHDPADASDSQPALCGHIHPVVKLSAPCQPAIRLACFHLTQQILTLPAFGSLTGGREVKPMRQDRIFLTHKGKVMEYPWANGGSM